MRHIAPWPGRERPGNGHLRSIGASFPAVVCPVLPGETTAKLRQSWLGTSTRVVGRTSPLGSGRFVTAPGEDGRGSVSVGGLFFKPGKPF